MDSSTNFNVAEFKNKLSDLLNRVAYRREHITITKRGRPIAKLVPIGDEKPSHLAQVQGWLKANDPFFDILDNIIEQRKDEGGRPIDLEND